MEEDGRWKIMQYSGKPETAKKKTADLDLNLNLINHRIGLD